MAGGSTEKEDGDRQCVHCGLWWSMAGLQNHEDNCDYRAVDRRVLELTDPFAIERAPEVDAEAALDAGEGRPEDATEAPGPSPGPSPEPDPAGGPGPEPESGPDVAPEAGATRTDGGPQAVPTDFEDVAGDADDTPAPDVDEEAEGCPNCGPDSTSMDVEEIPEPVLDAQPELHDYEEICIDCSTDAEGHLTGEAVVW